MNSENDRSNQELSPFDAAAAYLAARLGLTPDEYLSKQKERLRSFEFPKPECITPSEVVDLLLGEFSPAREQHVHDCSFCSSLLRSSAPNPLLLEQFRRQIRRQAPANVSNENRRRSKPVWLKQVALASFVIAFCVAVVLSSKPGQPIGAPIVQYAPHAPGSAYVATSPSHQEQHQVGSESQQITAPQKVTPELTAKGRFPRPFSPPRFPSVPSPSQPFLPPPPAVVGFVTPSSPMSIERATPFPPPLDNSTTGPAKKRLAITFDATPVNANVTAMFGGEQVNVGEMIRAMLTVRMRKSVNLNLLERNATLQGDIVVFGRDDNGKSKGGGNWGRIVGVTSYKKDEKAVVAIKLRIVDSETNNVIDTFEARGESSRKSSTWAGMTAGWVKPRNTSSGIDASNFEETIVGEATSNVVTRIIAWLNDELPKIVVKRRAIEGRVASISGSKMFITTGTEAVRLGDRFEIALITDEVKDPETKGVLDRFTVKVGEFVVNEVRPHGAFGEYGGQPVSLNGTHGYVAKLIIP